MNLPTELWYNIFSFLTNKSMSKFSCLLNLHNLDTKEIQLLYDSNNLWFETAQKGYIKLMKFLIKSGNVNNINKQCNYYWTALHYASNRGHKECVELLIQSGADVNIRDNYNATSLYYASIHKHSIYKDIIKLLIKAGADLNIQTNTGFTALHEASTYSHKDCIELLIKNGADLSIQDNNGWTALRWAKIRGCKDCFELLINAGAI